MHVSEQVQVLEELPVQDKEGQEVWVGDRERVATTLHEVLVRLYLQNSAFPQTKICPHQEKLSKYTFKSATQQLTLTCIENH